MKTGKNKLWVEKFRPQTLDDVIYQTVDQQRFFKNIIKTRDLPNLLLSGAQGTGKTTISLALVNDLEVDPADILLVKCSDETGVENIRDNVSRFAQSMPLGDIKLVRLEEFDFLSQNGQAILRHVIEDNSATCRFIATCNYANKIMPAVKSRFQEFHFKSPGQEDILVKMAEILDLENIEIDIDILEKIVAASYPDIRKTIQVLYQSSRSGKLVWKSSDVSSADYKFKLLDLLEAGNLTDARKLACETIPRDEYDDFYKWLYQNIHRVPKFASADKQQAAIVIIADYMFKAASVTHVDILLDAMFITLNNV